MCGEDSREDGGEDGGDREEDEEGVILAQPFCIGWFHACTCLYKLIYMYMPVQVGIHGIHDIHACTWYTCPYMVVMPVHRMHAYTW